MCTHTWEPNFSPEQRPLAICLAGGVRKRETCWAYWANPARALEAPCYQTWAQQSTHGAMWPCPGRIVQLVGVGQSSHPTPEQCELMKLLLCTWTSPWAIMARCRWYTTTLHPCQQALPTNFTKLLTKFFPELQNEGKLGFLGALVFRKTSSSTEVIPCVDESWSPIHRNLLCIAVALSASQLLYYFSRFCLHTLLLFFPYSQAPY